MIPFGYRRLRFTFELGEGRSFGFDKDSRLTVGVGDRTIDSALPGSGVTGLRAELQLVAPVLTHPGAAVIVIYGLTLDVMNRLTIAGRQWEGRRNRVLVEASTRGETDEDPWVAIYQGQIYQAYPMMNQQPLTPMVFFAAPGDTAALQLKPVEPESVEGGAKASQLVENVAKKVGYTIENNGVDGQLINPYLRGSALEQINTVLNAVDAYGTLSRTDNKVSIWPRDGERKGQVALLSPESGLIGYPEFETNQIKVRHMFDPAVIVDPGLTFRVESPLSAANGIWTSVQFELSLSCESLGGGADGGPWEMTILGIRSVASGASR
jgi:hypothetical protein